MSEVLYRCIAAIPNNGGACIQEFYLDNQEGYVQADAFAKKYNQPGWGVYDCVSLLSEPRRTKETVAAIPGLHWDIDARHVGASKEEIAKRVREKLEPFGLLSELRDSGRGIHVYSHFREPITAGTPEFEHAAELQARMVDHLGADPAVNHFASFMRRPGTFNSKEGGGLCQVILDTGVWCDLIDVSTYLDLIENNAPLFTTRQRGERPADADELPSDPEARLAIMRYEDETGRGVNATLPTVIACFIGRAMHPEDIHRKVMAALRATAGRDNLDWDWAKEDKDTNARIASAYRNVFEKEYDPKTGVPTWLPMEFHQAWAAALANGRRPSLNHNNAGWHIRSYANGNGADTDKASGNGADKSEASKGPFILRGFKPFDPAKLPRREFLFGTHYQRRVVSGTVAPGGTGKSSLEMVEAVGMAVARDLFKDKSLKERCRVWHHNGEDNMLELQRRLAAICQFYDIPQGELEGWFFMTSGHEMPLRVAENYNQIRLQFDHRLIKCITEQIGDNKIDVAQFDPLVTLHSVREADPGQMDAVIRIFGGIADSQNCAIDLSHHTRKMPAGLNGGILDIDDVRGAKAITDALRMVRLLNVMSSEDAENAGLMDIERTTYFRIDRGKGNYSAPGKTAIWRKFENVDLPNGDGVGVITAWQHPGDGESTPAKKEADRKTEHVVMEAFRRLWTAGIYMNALPTSPNNAAWSFPGNGRPNSPR